MKERIGNRSAQPFPEPFGFVPLAESTNPASREFFSFPRVDRFGLSDTDPTGGIVTTRQRPDREDSDSSVESRDAARSTGALRASAMPPVFVLLWSSAFIAGALGVNAAPPLLIVFARLASAGLLLTVITLIARAPWPRGRELRHVIVSGVLMQAVQFGSFYMALDTGLSAAVVAMLQGLNPIVVALLSSPLLGERLTGKQLLGFGLGALGVILAVFERLSFSPGGLALCGLGLSGLALGTVYQKRFTPRMNVTSGTTVQFLGSAPVAGIAMLLLETPRVSAWGPFLVALAWIVLVNSVGTFLLLNMMLRRSAANRVSSLFFLTPAVTAVLGWLLIGQMLQPAVIAGLLISGVGVLLASRQPPTAATRTSGNEKAIG